MLNLSKTEAAVSSRHWLPKDGPAPVYVGAGPTYLALLWWFAMNDPDVDAESHVNWTRARVGFSGESPMWWIEGVFVSFAERLLGAT